MKSALAQVPNKIGDLIMAHAKDLEEAWANIGDGVLKISFSAKIGFDKNQKGTCEVDIAFEREPKVKDSKTFAWSDIQMSLLKPLRDMCPKGEGESVTISSPGINPVTLTSEDRKHYDKLLKKEA